MSMYAPLPAACECCCCGAGHRVGCSKTELVQERSFATKRQSRTLFQTSVAMLCTPSFLRAGESHSEKHYTKWCGCSNACTNTTRICHLFQLHTSIIQYPTASCARHSVSVLKLQMVLQGLISAGSHGSVRLGATPTERVVSRY